MAVNLNPNIMFSAKLLIMQDNDDKKNLLLIFKFSLVEWTRKQGIELLATLGPCEIFNQVPFRSWRLWIIDVTIKFLLMF